MLLNKKYVWIFAVVLIIIEQGIKLVIKGSYLEANLPILTPWLYFKPMFNRDYSWVNSMLQLGIGKWFHIVIVAGMLVLIYLFYKFLNKQSDTTWFIDMAFVFIFSGAMCSFIDKVFWDGSLDYILIKGLFTFDLKDVYINVFIALSLLMVLVNSKGLRKAYGEDIVKDFVSFILRK